MGSNFCGTYFMEFICELTNENTVLFFFSALACYELETTVFIQFYTFGISERKRTNIYVNNKLCSIEIYMMEIRN